MGKCSRPCCDDTHATDIRISDTSPSRLYVLFQLRKTHQTPEFPPKRVIHNTVKVLELRRAALEAYLQTLLLVEPPPRPLLDFLGVQPQKRSAPRSWSVACPAR